MKGCKDRRGWVLLTAGCCLSVSVFLFDRAPAWSAASGISGQPRTSRVAILTHNLSVELVPAEHTLRASDKVVLEISAPDLRQVTFSLNAALSVKAIRAATGVNPHPLSFTIQAPDQPGERKRVQGITVKLDAPAAQGQVLTLEWLYEGIVRDPPRETRQLRFVMPSDTTGHIGLQGVYLSEETHWYPDVSGSLATFLVRVVTPGHWEAVTHGQLVSRTAQSHAVTTVWQVADRTEALTLVANRFIRTHREWRDHLGREIEVATYLLPENQHLAVEYIEASIQYLEAYSKLLGPYPFPKFAVVENFFPSGLGMPSLTLLGSGVVKRHYVQPFALGHEIVHSWLGNSVFNDAEQGNWVEGLTTYLANYYYDEMTGKAKEARDQRRMMLLGYAVYVRPEADYPIARFRQKSDQKDNAIGYQKCAMVFHMLRREIGDTTFWNGIRRLVSDYKGAYATWGDLERVFQETSGRDLRWFFAQWVERDGAPALKLLETRVGQAPQSTTGATRYWVSARIAQVGALFRLRLGLAVDMAGGKVHRTTIDLNRQEEVIALRVPGQPLALRVDPDFETFRRLSREQIPPILNLFVTDRSQVVVVPDAGPAKDLAPYQQVAERLEAQASPPGGLSIVRVSGESGPQPEESWQGQGSVLVLGGPGLNPAAAWAIQACAGRVSVGENRVTVGGRAYEGSGLALLVSCPFPGRPGSVVTLFFGMSPRAAAPVARLLFFYGWQSYLVFRDGAVVFRDDWKPARRELEVRFDGQGKSDEG